MRRATSFLSLALFVGTVGFAVACSDQQPASPTAPAAGAAGIATSQGVSTSQVSGGGKPTPAPVGFTKVIQVNGQFVAVPANGSAGGWATCPVGTTVIGGGYSFTGYNVMNPPWVQKSRMDQNGWAVGVINEALNSSAAGFTVYAYCAS